MKLDGIEVLTRRPDGIVDDQRITGCSAKIFGPSRRRSAIWSIARLEVPAFQQSAVFFARGASDIPCSLLAKLPHDITLRTEAQQPVAVPKGALFYVAVLFQPLLRRVRGASTKQ